MTTTPPLDGVAATALLTAYARAQETARANRLFDDPLARVFVMEATGATGDGLPRMGMARDDGTSPLWYAFGSYFVIRTPFFDDGLAAASARGVRQVVVLASGMDTRAFRLGIDPGTTVFEVDRPEVQTFKERVLRQRGERAVCRRITVEADLREDWTAPLRAAGFDPARPTAWLAEGLLPYFAEGDCNQLRDTITRLSRPGSVLLTDYAARPAERTAVVDRAVDGAEEEMAGELTDLGRPGPGTAPDVWLGALGWSVESTTAVGEFRRLGRELPAVADETAADVPAWLVKATLGGSEVAG